MCVMSEEQKPIAEENAGAALARKRWARTTAQERSEIAREMNRARWGKRRRPRGKKRGR